MRGRGDILGWARTLASGPAFAGLAMVAMMAAIHFANFASSGQLGLLVFDAYQRATPRTYEDAAVRIVDIDEESLKRLGQWPWPRTQIARLTDRLTEAGAAAIAFDIVFAEPDRTSPDQIAAQLTPDKAALAATLKALPTNDQVLANSLASSPAVNGLFLLKERRGGDLVLPSGMAVLGSTPSRMVQDYAGSVQPLPVLRKASAGLGSLSIEKDMDGIVRKAPLVFLYRGELVPSLSLEALRVAQGADASLIKTSDGTGEIAGIPGDMVSVKTGQFTVPTTAAGELWLHYTRPQPSRTIPAWQILSERTRPQALQDAVKGRIVFVGASAIGLRDLIATPLADGVPGVSIHAQAVEQMVLGSFLTRPDWARGLELFLVITLGTLLALTLSRVGAIVGASLGVAGIASVAAGSWFAFKDAGFLLDPTFPILTLILVYLVQTLLGFYQEERRRSYIHNAFDRYLSPEMVRQIAANPDRLQLGGEEREMTVMFCDIRGFSHISEQYEPQELINFLTGFLTPMCDILIGNRATVDKFIGDAILAFWNAPLDDPDQFENAARAALAMNAALGELNIRMPLKDGQVWPDNVQIGIGLNAGPCCVGNMGSQQRLSYSLIGDTVNIASRFEGLTKQYGVPILIGSALAKQIGGFALLEIDRVKVVGRDAPDTIHALLGDNAAALSPLVSAHDLFLAAYRAQDWDEARTRLEENATLYDQAGLSRLRGVFLNRIMLLETQAPRAGWDGVFQATEK